MIYSKIFKHSNCIVRTSIKNLKYFHNYVRPYLINTSVKVSSAGSLIYDSKCQYSTLFNSRKSQFVKPFRNNYLQLNLTALLSTVENKDSYQIVITNPSEGISNTLESSLDSIKNAGFSTPEISDTAATLTEQLSTAAELVEPTLESLGLAKHTPVGVIQMFLEYLHVTMHWPWWLTIVTCTVIARILLIPLLVKTQRNAINMANYMPQLQYLQAKFGEARRTGNSMEANRYASEMMMYMKSKNISPFKNALLPLLQAPVFLSFFFALRGMAKVPVESMKDGGIWWVTDLTIPDPYYILPVVCCATLYVVLKIGAESGVKMDNLKMAKYFMQALPVIALPFTIHFPSAVLYYWVTNNFMTLIIVSILKIKPIRQFCNLPVQAPIDPKYVAPKKGFIQGMKEAFEDQKALAAVEDRRRIDNVRFQKAGTGPIPRTYSYDPTKPRPSNVASLAKAVAAKKHN